MPRHSKNSEQHSRINWVPHISVRPGPNELMVNLKYHFIAPVLAKVDTRPQCSDQTDKCSGEPAICNRGNVRQEART